MLSSRDDANRCDPQGKSRGALPVGGQTGLNFRCLAKQASWTSTVTDWPNRCHQKAEDRLLFTEHDARWPGDPAIAASSPMWKPLDFAARIGISADHQAQCHRAGPAAASLISRRLIEILEVALSFPVHDVLRRRECYSVGRLSWRFAARPAISHIAARLKFRCHGRYTGDSITVAPGAAPSRP